MDGEKITLTPEMVQQRLRRLALSSLAFCGMWMLAVSPFTIVIFFISVVPHIIEMLTVPVLLFSAFMLPYVANSVAALAMSFRRPVMIKASLVKPVGEKDFRGDRLRYRYYMMYFHGYGKRRYDGNVYLPFDVGFEEWMSTFEVRNNTDEGDKFYLLVDKFNRIVFFFPCKYFEYTGDVIPSKYER